MHGVITSTDYSAGVQTTFRAGGCNCSRGGFIGACLAAQVCKKETIHVVLNEHNKVSLFKLRYNFNIYNHNIGSIGPDLKQLHANVSYRSNLQYSMFLILPSTEVA